eukprot:8251204-Pyramimonas_sp.AAC.1
MLSGWDEFLVRFPIRLGRWGARLWTLELLPTHWLGQRPARQVRVAIGLESIVSEDTAINDLEKVPRLIFAVAPSRLA